MEKDYFKGITIINESYQTIFPMPLINAICVFSFEDGYKCFQNVNFLDYIIALKDDNTWFKCSSIKDLEEFYKTK